MSLLHRSLRLFLVLFCTLVTLAQAANQACVVCSSEQKRIHQEECSLSETWNNDVYFFCRAACREAFLENPQEWAQKYLELQAAPQKFQEGKLPDFHFPLDPIGSLALEDLKDKVVLINLWATWCAPCMKEMPDLVRLQEEYGDRGLVVLGLSFDRSRATHAQGVKDLKLNFLSIYADQPEVEEFLKKVGPPDSIPVTLVVDRDMKVVKRLEEAADYKTLQKLVEPLLKKGEQVSKRWRRGSIVPS